LIEEPQDLLDSSEESAPVIRLVNSLLQQLIDLGYDGIVFSRTEGGEPVHFVQLGPYGSEERAKQIARDVRYEADVDPLVVVERGER
jgi:hypothetical protein